MARYYTPVVRFANSGSAAFKKMTQTVEQTRQVPSDHVTQHDHHSGVLRFNRDWRQGLARFLFKPVPSECRRSVINPNDGGETIWVYGSNFTTDSTLYINSVLVSGTVFFDEHSGTFPAPNWPQEENVTVKVVRPDLMSGTNDQIFAYEYEPRIIGVIDSGTVWDSLPITITGSYLKPGSTVEFRSGSYTLSSSNVANTQPGLIGIVPPARMPGPGTYDVRVISPAPSHFPSDWYSGVTFIHNAPVLDLLVPSYVSYDADPITVTAVGKYFLSGAAVSQSSGLVSGTWVDEATLYSTRVTYQTVTQVEATTASIAIQNPDGKTSSPLTFRYVENLPTIFSITPLEAIAEDRIYVTGTHLDGAHPTLSASLVTGTMYYSASFNIVSDSAVWVTMSNVPPGQYYIELSSSTGVGSSAPTAVTMLSYPAIYSVNPPSGLQGGGYTVGIAGNNFITSSVVTVDSVAAPVTYVNSQNLSIVMPPGSATGVVQIRVSNYGTLHATSTFEYTAATSIVSGTVFVPNIGA